MNTSFLASLLGLALGTAAPRAADATPTPALAERLGYTAADRLLIVNGDDAGMCLAANVGTLEALEHGLMTSATVMVPCPWFYALAAYARNHPTLDLGVHLCHTAEWKGYRWGPVLPKTEVPGLVDPDGCFWSSVEQVYAHSTPDEALREARAQVRKAIASGLDLTHLDSHMGVLQYDVRYMDSYLALAVEFDLPVRMASQETLEKFQQPALRSRFSKAGILFPDYLVHEELRDASRDVKGFWMKTLKTLRPGVTEVYIHTAKPTEELQAITGSWRTRGAEQELFARDPDLRRLLETERIQRIGYRPLRDLQRRLRQQP
ncbi:MAG TPA: polysaccharide deacetylase family protein [Verrucomicrobiota bacterium]|nr:polysaccharide deacetylase family protein [Verrucomicrobiota bacterium]HNU52495.1 polysaccharide deacetylase family protein [Verrucomicrobiota bacterium]